MTDSYPSAQWRVFLHALAEEIDGLGGAGARDELLRGVGRRIAAYRPILPVAGVDLVEAEMNDGLAAMGWGSVSLRPGEAVPSLLLVHSGLPRIGGNGDPPGTWLSAALEGLYQGWLAQVPGADPEMKVRREAVEARRVTLRYTR